MHSYLLELMMACILIDTAFTWHRLGMSPKLELNPLVRWLAKKFGAGLAAVIGVMAIQMTGAVLLALLSNPIPLAILAGAGVNRSWMQIMSIELEDKILHAGSSVPLPSPGSRKGLNGKS